MARAILADLAAVAGTLALTLFIATVVPVLLRPGPSDCGYCKFDEPGTIDPALHEDNLTSQEFRSTFARPGRPVVINMSDPSAVQWAWSDFRGFDPLPAGADLSQVNARGGCVAITAAAFAADISAAGGQPGSCEWYYLLRTDPNIAAGLADRIGARVGRRPRFMDGLSLLDTYWFYIAHITSSEMLAGIPYHVGYVGATGTFHAQIRGRKRWFIKALPQCHAECGALERTWVVHPGQWVFLNSDWWVHRAAALPELDGDLTPMSLSVAREINDDDYASSMMVLQGLVLVVISLMLWGRLALRLWRTWMVRPDDSLASVLTEKKKGE